MIFFSYGWVTCLLVQKLHRGDNSMNMPFTVAVFASCLWSLSEFWPCWYLSFLKGIQSSGVLEFWTPWLVCFITASGHVDLCDQLCRKQLKFCITPWDPSLVDPSSVRNHWHFHFNVYFGPMRDKVNLVFVSPPALPPSSSYLFQTVEAISALKALRNSFLNYPWKFSERNPLRRRWQDEACKANDISLLLFASFISCRQPPKQQQNPN